MKNWKTEYKILLFFGILFFIILIIFLIKNDTFNKLRQNYKKEQLVTCTTQTSIKGIEYTDYTCVVKDETGNSYTIAYPQIEASSDDIENLNRQLKSDFNKIYNSVVYLENDDKVMFEKYEKTNYKIYNSMGVVSFLVERQDIIGNIKNTVDQYSVYNIDLATLKILDDDDLKEKLGIDRDYSSSLRGMVVMMYLSEFRYDYNNELPVYRNRFIDESVEDVTYRAIDDIYIDDDGNIHFILFLFNPDKGEKIPYNFTIDKNKNTTYKIAEAIS